jgi:sterol desaturase/sphingolipid hydroxylase (fatty acid hydroxylase superfamily)
MTADLSIPLFVTVWTIQMVAYHGFGLAFLWLDRTGRLTLFKTRPVERKPYGAILPRVLVNQVFVLLPAMGVAQALGLGFTGAAHVPWYTWLAFAIGFPLGHDIVQYIFHRFVLHRAALMNRLGHAVHHSTTASCSISACYMSPADFFFEIVLPYLVPLALLGGGGSDVVFHAVTVTAGAFGGLYEHSGYDFGLALARAPGDGVGAKLSRALAVMLSSRAHAEHHSRGNVSFSDGFGSTSLCDTILHTRWDLVQDRRRRRAEPAPAMEG